VSSSVPTGPRELAEFYRLPPIDLRVERVYGLGKAALGVTTIEELTRVIR
jgi:hypothetical protein